MVYASNDQSERQLLRDAIETIHLGRSKPWVVLGDMNNVLYSFVRVGGEPVHPCKTTHLVECLNNVDLADIKSKGYFYTLVKIGDRDKRVQSKIDRCLINLEWLIKMLDSTANYLPTRVSDHNSILIKWSHVYSKYTLLDSIIVGLNGKDLETLLIQNGSK